MTTASIFDYDMFINLSDAQLMRYMEPLLPSLPDTPPALLKQRFLADLDTMDYVHLVYAIELLSYWWPEEAAAHLPSFLTNSHKEVQCAADGALMSLPSHLITQELLDNIHIALTSATDTGLLPCNIISRLHAKRGSLARRK